MPCHGAVALFPNCTFTLLDLNPIAADLAAKRVEAAGLHNVRVQVGRIEHYDEPFDVAISLHACGSASDFVQLRSMSLGAAYVMAPYCMGGEPNRGTQEYGKAGKGINTPK